MGGTCSRVDAVPVEPPTPAKEPRPQDARDTKPTVSVSTRREMRPVASAPAAPKASVMDSPGGAHAGAYGDHGGGSGHYTHYAGLSESNLRRFDSTHHYRSGNSNAIKKRLFERLHEDSVRFSQMEPEPVPAEFLSALRDARSEWSGRTTGSHSTAQVESPHEAPPRARDAAGRGDEDAGRRARGSSPRRNSRSNASSPRRGTGRRPGKETSDARAADRVTYNI